MINLGEIVCQECSGKLVKKNAFSLCTKCGAKWIITRYWDGRFKSMEKKDIDPGEEKMTLKEFIQRLKEIFQYVRLLKLKKTLILDSTDKVLDSTDKEFDRMIVCSQELEEYSELQFEIDNFRIFIERSDSELLFYQFIPEVNIPIFLLRTKPEIKFSEFKRK